MQLRHSSGIAWAVLLDPLDKTLDKRALLWTEQWLIY